METLNDEMDVMLAGTALKKYWPGVKNQARNKKGSTQDYMCQLSPEQFRKITDVYKIDMELFSYSADDIQCEPRVA